MHPEYLDLPTHGNTRPDSNGDETTSIDPTNKRGMENNEIGTYYICSMFVFGYIKIGCFQLLC